MKKSRNEFKLHDLLERILMTEDSDRAIAEARHVSKTTVGRYRQLVAQKGWDLADLRKIKPGELNKLFNRPSGKASHRKRQPDWEQVFAEMQRPNVTITLLWEEYRKPSPDDALSYSQMAHHYRRLKKQRPSEMRRYHEPGAEVYVDYSGEGPSYIDPQTGIAVRLQLFVAVLPASSLIFATCVPTQGIADFITGHIRMFEYYGGVPGKLVCDNLKAAVIRPGPNPLLTPAFEDYARHHEMLVDPARPYRPRDKGTVESSVGFVQNNILGALRNHVFHSMEEVNAAIAEKLEELNDRPMKEYKVSRRERFTSKEKELLRPLPRPYVYTEYVELPAVPQDYHVCIRGHYYSVPHTLIGKRLDARISDDIIEILSQRECVARHKRSLLLGHHTTLPEHQPPNHRYQAERTPAGVKEWAAREGGDLLRFVQHQFEAASQPYLAMPACDGVRTLVHKFGAETVQAACHSAFEVKSITLSTVRRFLSQGATNHRKKPTVSRSRTRGERPTSSPPHAPRNVETPARSQAS